jgi:hypothetical protein
LVEGYQKYAPPTPGSFYRKFEHGRALRGAGIIYRAVLLPISGGGVAIDHALGAVNYRSLRADRGALDAGQFPTFTEAAGR